MLYRRLADVRQLGCGLCLVTSSAAPYTAQAGALEPCVAGHVEGRLMYLCVQVVWAMTLSAKWQFVNNYYMLISGVPVVSGGYSK